MDTFKQMMKLLLIVVLLFCFFHPLVAVVFIVSNLGIITGILLCYIVLRLILGMSLLSFISKTLEDKED